MLVSNAGIATCGPIDELELSEWERNLAVNSTGHFLMARAALRLFKAQAIGGNVVFVATKNVVAPGKDFGAYSASKAAEAQLARVVAMEGGEFGIRANVLNPDAVFGRSNLWSDELRTERARSYGISPFELEDHYRRRSLLGVEVTAEDVAEAALFLARATVHRRPLAACCQSMAAFARRSPDSENGRANPCRSKYVITDMRSS